MQMNSLPAGGAVGGVEIEVSPVTLYTKQRSSHKRCFTRHYMRDEMKITFIYLNDILRDRFVISQTPEIKAVVQTSHLL